MPLWFPWIVGVTVRDSGGNVVSGATVNVKDMTNDQGVASSSTNASGKCILNIQNYSSDGDTIKVYCTHGGEYDEVSFTLNVFAPSKLIDLNLGAVAVVFGLHPGGMAKVMVGCC